ncbi:unnamed protein product [Polarella glacialis]|uniref:Uncharacterized protein n=1 Tax=Polarella glacialis TaxID=89957 RepID=A0A813IJ37_POLGL|nr:unnamed protein product [Polarella glacialis]
MYKGLLGLPPPGGQSLGSCSLAPVFRGGGDDHGAELFRRQQSGAGNGRVEAHRAGPSSQVERQTPTSVGGSDDWQSLVRREISQQIAASIQSPPAYSSTPVAPVQFIIQNTSSATSTQKVVNTAPPPEPSQRPPRKFTGSWEDLEEFWTSPLNRICVFGVLGLVCYIYHGHSQHRWRMLELQRRIDSNPFLRVVQQFFGASSTR